MKVTYTQEAVADIVEAIAYLNERSPTATAPLDADVARCASHGQDRNDRGRVPRPMNEGLREAISSAAAVFVW